MMTRKSTAERTRGEGWSIPWAKPVFMGKEKKYVLDALTSTWISGGPYVERFEKKFSGLHKKRYGLGVSNGTTALHLGLLGLGIGPGDEVIIPGFTFVASGNTVIQCGANPVFCDIDEDTFCIDVKKIEALITPKTKAIMPVHLYGNVCDMGAIMKIARKHKLLVIEDNAESCFSTFKGKYAGTFGDVGCFSFQATKTITMGEGGAILTDNKQFADRMRILRSHGMSPDKRYWHDAVGYNYRITNLQAALGCAQLEQRDTFIRERKRIYRTYTKLLSDHKEFVPQQFMPEVDPVLWTFVVRLADPYRKKSRDQIIAEMHSRGVETRPGFYPFTVLPLYDKYTKGHLPVSEKVGRTAISLPTYPNLDDAALRHISSTLLKAVRGKA